MFDRLAGERDGSWFLTALRRRWWVIVVTAVIGALSAYVLSSRQTKKYTATAAVQFTNSRFDLTLAGVNPFSVSNGDPARQAATEQSLLQLQTIPRLVAGSLHIPVNRVKSDITVGSNAQSDVVPVTATDPSPALAARIANTYVAQFILFQQQTARNQLQATANQIQSNLGKIPLSQRGGPIAQPLIAELQKIQFLMAAQTGNAAPAETATVPTSPSYPSPKKDAILGLLLGLLVGSGLVGVLERRDRRVKSPDEVEEVYGVPVIGMIPESGLLRSGGVPTPREEEAFLMIRAQLRYFDVDRNIQVVMVSSAESGEGKTMVSLNLARAAARADGKRALLIEADLRRPTLTRLIGRESVAGLAELLSHSQDLHAGLRELVVTPDQVQHSERPVHLDILLAGSVPPNPVELLESKRMIELLDAAASMYDIVVIDTAPIGVVSDAIPLAHQVDGVLLISRVGVSHRDQAARLMKRLRGLNAHILGVVVNSFKPGSGSRYGYYGYYQPTDAEVSPRRGRRSRQKSRLR
ncbi:MAG: polysaccharide biosynthesis tyrosine autokinase [Actinomycetota bacterium]|nr:polysaccharide biosynthesis tyrosine autokinase [Actinomycetota bacterium]